MRTPRATAATILTLACLLAGCSDDGEPDAEPTPEPSSEPASPSTSAAAGSGPDHNALDTVHAWVKAYNRALRTGNVTEASALTAPGCDTCDYELEPIIRVYDAGGFFKGGQYKVVGAKPTSQTKNRAVIPVAIRAASGSTVEAVGSEPIQYAKEQFIYQMTLRRVSSRWRISEIVYLR